MTLKQAKDTVQPLGFTLKRTGYGKEVVLRNKFDGSTYYTDDLDDAVGTAKLSSYATASLEGAPQC